MTELILIRHGETDWNVEHRIQGHMDTPLNRAGLQQAEAIGERFREVDIDVLVSSDLRRAMQTMQPIAEGRTLPILRDVRLRERHLGILQGKTTEEAQRVTPSAFEIWHSRSRDAELEKGESLAAFARRVTAALTELTQTHKDKRIVAVTHGGVLDIAYRHATATALEAPRTFSIHNASVNTFRADEQGFQIVVWSDISHLPDKQALDEF